MIDLENGKPSTLTFEIETLGETGGPAVIPTLLAALDHASAVVREGAIYGASHHLSDAALRAKVENLARTDPSPAVRAVAADALEADA